MNAWASAVASVCTEPDSAAVHLRVSFPCEPAVGNAHQAVSDALVAHHELSVEQVANTIFPWSLYRSQAADPAALLYENWNYARRINARRNGRAITYFDRLTHYPGKDGTFNQLEHQILKLRSELSGRSTFRSIYELGLTGEAELRFMAPDVDRPRRSFPCLSHISLTVAKGALNLMAQYRYQYLLRKALGNYLGLSRLLTFIANEVDISPGLVTVNSAYARVDKESLGGIRKWERIARSVRTSHGE